MLLAIGVVANTQELLSNKVKLDQDRGYIKVNEKYETSTPGIYAAGDIIGPPWLAHVATYEAIQAVQGMFNHSKTKKVKNYPGCTYCTPQVASIGKTEKKLKEEGALLTKLKIPISGFRQSGSIKYFSRFCKVACR